MVNSMSRLHLNVGSFYRAKNGSYVHIIGRKFIEGTEEPYRKIKIMYIGYVLDNNTGFADPTSPCIVYKDDGESELYSLEPFDIVEEILSSYEEISLSNLTFYAVLSKEEYQNIRLPSGSKLRKTLYRTLEAAKKASTNVDNPIILKVKKEGPSIPEPIIKAYNIHARVDQFPELPNDYS